MRHYDINSSSRGVAECGFSAISYFTSDRILFCRSRRLPTVVQPGIEASWRGASNPWFVVPLADRFSRPSPKGHLAADLLRSSPLRELATVIPSAAVSTRMRRDARVNT